MADVKIPISAAPTETVETIWPVLEMEVATGNVSILVTERGVAPTPSASWSITGPSADARPSTWVTPTLPWAAPRWSVRRMETAAETRSVS